MRQIEVEEGLRVRFAGRGDEFDEGVEIGLLCAAMAAGRREFTRTMTVRALEQAHALAERMSYRVHVVLVDGIEAEVMFLTGARRPKLTLVHSAMSA